MFGFALSNEPANVPWAVLDRDQSPLSRRLVAEIQATGYFEPARTVTSYDAGEALLAHGEISLLLVVPPELSREAARGRPELQLVLDGSDPLTAARMGGYVGELLRRFDPAGRAAHFHELLPPVEGDLGVRGAQLEAGVPSSEAAGREPATGWMRVAEGGVDDAGPGAARRFPRGHDDAPAEVALDPVVGPALEVGERVAVLRRAHRRERVDRRVAAADQAVRVPGPQASLGRGQFHPPRRASRRRRTS